MPRAPTRIPKPEPRNPSALSPAAVFANPIAGRGRGATIAREIAHRLRAGGIDAAVHLDRADRVPDGAIAAARSAVVIGGDGTLRAVAARFYGLLGAVPPLLPVPMGTANLMARHLGMRWADRDVAALAAASVRRGHVVRLDAATANGALFLLVAGVGIDAHVVHELDRVRRGPINYLSYALPAALAFGAYRFPPLRVSIDGRAVFDDRPAIAFVANVAEYGTGFPVLPLARPDDGLLDVAVIPCKSRGELAEILLHAAAGEHLSREGVRTFKAESIEIDAATAVPTQLDGDAAGHTPVRIEVLAGKAAFVVPESGETRNEER